MPTQAAKVSRHQDRYEEPILFLSVVLSPLPAVLCVLAPLREIQAFSTAEGAEELRDREIQSLNHSTLPHLSAFSAVKASVRPPALLRNLQGEEVHTTVRGYSFNRTAVP